MTDKPNNSDNVKFSTNIDELKDRINFLAVATTSLLEDKDGVPTDSTICGILHAFSDCQNLVDGLSLAEGA